MRIRHDPGQRPGGAARAGRHPAAALHGVADLAFDDEAARAIAAAMFSRYEGAVWRDECRRRGLDPEADYESPLDAIAARTPRFAQAVPAFTIPR